MSTSTYPVHVDAQLDPGLSRWQWLFKWFLAIPHYVVLAFLWVAFVVLSVVAFLSILVTGRYPRSIFEFNVGVLRWTWRVAYYAYGTLGTDRYPPFSLDERADYPAHLEIDYPEHLSRGLVLVKSWLLAIPHYLVLALFLGGTGFAIGEVDKAGEAAETPWLWSTGLVGLLVLVAAVVLLFTGSYPRSVFDFVLGMNRWALRVAAYAALMTDQYPPFRLDQGGADPAGHLLLAPPAPVGTVSPPSSSAPSSAPSSSAPSGGPAPTRGGSWTAGRVVSLVLASMLAVGSLGLTGAGTALLVADRAMRDDAGFLMSDEQSLVTETYALVSTNVEVQTQGPADVMPDALLGDVRLTATSGTDAPVFVGIAPTADVEAYLAGVDHETVVDLTVDPVYSESDGGAPASAPGAQDFWAAQAAGPGAQTLTWEIENGDWTVVVMNPDGSAGVEADVAAGAEVPALDWLVPLLLSIGVTGLVLAALWLTLVVRSAATR